MAALSQLAQQVLPWGPSVQFQMPFLSSRMKILPKAQRSCKDKAIHHPEPVGQVRAADEPFDTTGFKKNTASLTRQP